MPSLAFSKRGASESISFLYFNHGVSSNKRKNLKQTQENGRIRLTTRFLYSIGMYNRRRESPRLE